LRLSRILACCLVGGALSSPALAGQVMTGREFLAAEKAGGTEKELAERYFDGSVHTIVIMNDMFSSSEAGFLCPTETTEAAITSDQMKGDFTAWLEEKAKDTAGGEVDVLEAPLGMLTFSFTLETIGCSEAEAGSGGDGLKSLLRRSLGQ
jgi:hypothetical protein